MNSAQVEEDGDGAGKEKEDGAGDEECDEEADAEALDVLDSRIGGFESALLRKSALDGFQE